MDYRICPECGAALDPGEICDCRKETDPENKKAAMPASTAANPLKKGDNQ